MKRLHTMPARGYASYRCLCCGRLIRTIADEYGDHGCICGWEPRTLADDVREYVERCIEGGDIPDAFDFAAVWYPRHKNVPGRKINELIAKELAKYDRA